MVASRFSIDRFVEDLFEIVACYFPITFTPSPDDGFGITRDDLVLGLRACLAATPTFGPYGIEMLLEKLSSSIKETKVCGVSTTR